MASIKKEHTIHLYLLTDLTPPREVFDSFDWRSIKDCMKNRVYLGSQTIEVIWPDYNAAEVAIESLREEIKKERADSEVRVNLLLERISKLQAIGHEGEAK